jgi:hypothetical protein
VCCQSDLPTCDPLRPRGECYSLKYTISDAWCDNVCNAPRDGVSPYHQAVCEPSKCQCEEMSFLKGDPIQEKTSINISQMPDRTEHLVRRVEATERRRPGLPDCLWKPGPGCTNTTPYECLDNGKCSAANWYPYDDWARPCRSSCLHVALLHPAPYYALWRPGPLARPFVEGDQLPRYAEHSGMGAHMKVRLITRAAVVANPHPHPHLNPDP